MSNYNNNSFLSDKQEMKIRNFFNTRAGKKYTAKAIIKKLNLKGSKDITYKILDRLTKEKFIQKDQNSQYGKGIKSNSQSASSKKIRGYVDMTKSGSAYIITEDWGTDIYISSNLTGTALNGDLVEIEITRYKKNKKAEGKIIRVIERAVEEVVAIITQVNNRAIAEPKNRDFGNEILINIEDLNGAEENDHVLIKITEYPKNKNQKMRGQVIRVINNMPEHEYDDLNILIESGFNPIFPDSISEQVQEIHNKGIEWKAEDRRDFRNELTVTIDPADAKDFDDAISFKNLENGQVEIGIHIADVTHYIPQDSLLDEVALKRATSVYLVGRVCPMLPEVLSNDLCSLVEGKDRLTFSVVVTFDKKNKIIDVWYGKTVINSNKRYSYEEAQEIIEGKKAKYGVEIRKMFAISKEIRKKRENEGSIRFNSQEVKFNLDENKFPVSLYIKTQKEANLMIEDFMLLANRLVATYMVKKAKLFPFIFRLHDSPDETKISDLSLMAKMLGFNFYTDNEHVIRKSFNRLHEATKENEALKILQILGIRSMAKAEYGTTHIGHFGLAFEHYTHFTSPIRRYADVLVHRILFAFLNEEKQVYTEDKLKRICDYISRRERMAMSAERDSIRAKQSLYMEKYIGTTMKGKIRAIIERGIFIDLNDTGISGFVSFASLDESFQLHPTGFSATGIKTRTKYSLGDKVEVNIDKVDTASNQIDLSFID